MFITPAYAQGVGGLGGIGEFLFPLVAMFAIFYFLLIRPQQKRAKQHRELVTNLRRGDTVVTSGGLIGKVSKVLDDNEAMIEISEGVKIKILKQFVTEVRVKGEPASDDTKS